MPTHLRTTSPLAIDGPRAALQAAQAARASVAGEPPDDPDRREILADALETLTQSWTAEHIAYMRSGRQIGRAVSEDPVRVLRAEMVAETKRLRAALRRTSGTKRVPLQPITGKAMQGRLGRFAQVLDGIERDHEAARNVLDGSGALDASRLREETAALLERLQAERRAVQVAWARYARWEPPHDPKHPYAHRDLWDRNWDRLTVLRRHADELTADLKRPAPKHRPPAPPARRTWTPDDVRAAVDAFEQTHGRRPKKAEMHPRHDLPHYTQARRTLGSSPLT